METALSRREASAAACATPLLLVLEQLREDFEVFEQHDEPPQDPPASLGELCATFDALCDGIHILCRGTDADLPRRRRHADDDAPPTRSDLRRASKALARPLGKKVASKVNRNRAESAAAAAFPG